MNKLKTICLLILLSISFNGIYAQQEQTTAYERRRAELISQIPQRFGLDAFRFAVSTLGDDLSDENIFAHAEAAELATALIGSRAEHRAMIWLANELRNAQGLRTAVDVQRERETRERIAQAAREAEEREAIRAAEARQRWEQRQEELREEARQRAEEERLRVFFDLAGRSLDSNGLVRPRLAEDDNGRVVVNITIDPAGNVIEAEIGRGTTATNTTLHNEILRAARATRFNAINSVNNQRGAITYTITKCTISTTIQKETMSEQERIARQMNDLFGR